MPYYWFDKFYSLLNIVSYQPTSFFNYVSQTKNNFSQHIKYIFRFCNHFSLFFLFLLNQIYVKAAIIPETKDIHIGIYTHSFL